MASKRTAAVRAAQTRLRERLEGQLRAVDAIGRADEQVEAARQHLVNVRADNQTRLAALRQENNARVTTAEETIGLRRQARAEALAGLAVMVNDDTETASLAGVAVSEVRTARKTIPVERAREVATAAARPKAAAAANGTAKPAPPARPK